MLGQRRVGTSRIRGAVAVGVAGAALALLASNPTIAMAQARTSHAGVVVHATPDQGLTGGVVVALTGRGLGKPPADGAPVWFVTQCTAAVRGRMNPSTDTDHCDITNAQALRISKSGTFATHFRVTSGIVGDGYCGTAGHTTCVLAVSTVEGRGTVVSITFAVAPHPVPSTTVTPRGATPGG